LCVSAGTISYYLAKGIIKYAPQFKTQIQNDKAIIQNIDKLEDLSKKVVDDLVVQVLTKTGSGGLLKFETIISRNMLKQEHEMSCAAACIKQLAKDNGIEITENTIRKISNTTIDTGTFPSGMIEGMKKSFKNQVIDYGMKFNPKLTDIEMAKKLSDDGSWIAFILPKNSNVQHSIIIEK